VLPYSDPAEAREILQDFIRDFQEHGIKSIWAHARKRLAPGACVEFSILAGLALGQPIADIDAIIASAEIQQKEIGRLRCTAEE
jgi:hypothetical protein